MAAEGVNAARAAAGKQLTLQEAQMILGVESGATWEEVVKVTAARIIRSLWLGGLQQPWCCGMSIWQRRMCGGWRASRRQQRRQCQRWPD